MIHSVILLDAVSASPPANDAAGEQPVRTPPTEFRIFRKGRNESIKGAFNFDKGSAKKVMERAQKWGNRFPFDYAHGMVKHTDGENPAEQHKAAGWFTPEVRNGELWATKIAWTPKAEQYLKDGEYAYFSPAFDVDKDDNVVELTNVALTNVPAMQDIDSLVACSQGEESAAREESIRMTREEARGAIHKAHEAIHGKMHDDAARAVLDSKINGMKMSEIKEYCESLQGFLGADDDAEKSDQGTTEKTASKAAPEEVSAGSAEKAESKAAPEEVSAGSAEKAESKVDKDPDTSIPKEIAASQAHSLVAKVREITGTSNDEEALGALLAIHRTASRVPALEEQVRSVQLSHTEDSREALLATAVKDGKITPAEAKGEGPDGEFIKSLSMSQLKGYVSRLHSRVTTEPTKVGSPLGGDSTFQVEGRPVSLSKFELDLCKKNGTKPEDYAATKAKTSWASRQG